MLIYYTGSTRIRYGFWYVVRIFGPRFVDPVHGPYFVDIDPDKNSDQIKSSIEIPDWRFDRQCKRLFIISFNSLGTNGVLSARPQKFEEGPVPSWGRARTRTVPGRLVLSNGPLIRSMKKGKISVPRKLKVPAKIVSSGWRWKVTDEVWKFWFNLERINEVGKLPL